MSSSNKRKEFVTIIRRDQPQAIFQQIKNYIGGQIKSGKWPPGTRIPSENEIVVTLGVSRSTVHRAFRELTFEGYLFRVLGVGTFVASNKYYSTLLEIKPISEEIAERGGKHTCDVHLVTKVSASAEIASALAVPQDSLIFHSLIVHRENGVAIQLDDRYVNPAFAPDYVEQDFSIITPSQYLFQIAPPTEAEHILGAVLPDEQTQNLLEIGPTEPCLLLNRRTWVGNVVATKAKLLHPGSRFILGGRFKPLSSIKPI